MFRRLSNFIRLLPLVASLVVVLSMQAALSEVTYAAPCGVGGTTFANTHLTSGRAAITL